MRQGLLLFAFLADLLSAQSKSSEGQAFQFNGGLIGGGTASQIHGDGIGGFNKIGLHLGTTIEIGWSENKKTRIQHYKNYKTNQKR